MPEPVREPEPAAPAEAARPPVEPEAARKGIEPLVEPKPEPRKQPADGARASSSVAAIPATFFDPSQLTEKPRPLNEPRVDLLLPMLARGGVAKLALYVDESGNVERVEVESATLPPAAVERAVAIFTALRFSPGRFDGTAVKTRVRITVGAEERTREN